MMNNPFTLITASPLEVFAIATGKKPEEALKTVLDMSLFLAPDIVRKLPAQFPDCVRESREHHPGVHKGGLSTWRGKPVHVWDNTKARNAFGKYIGKSMGGQNRGVAIGWEIAHVWGRVFDPEYFTAGWNMVLMPGFLRLMTEEQSQLKVFSDSLQFLAHRLYFSERSVFMPFDPPRRVDPNGLPSWVLDYKPQLIAEKSLWVAA